MDVKTLVGMISIIIAGMTMFVGSISPALGMARAVAQALSSIASSRTRRTLLLEPSS